MKHNDRPDGNSRDAGQRGKGSTRVQRAHHHGGRQQKVRQHVRQFECRVIQNGPHPTSSRTCSAVARIGPQSVPEPKAQAPQHQHGAESLFHKIRSSTKLCEFPTVPCIGNWGRHVHMRRHDLVSPIAKPWVLRNCIQGHFQDHQPLPRRSAIDEGSGRLVEQHPTERLHCHDQDDEPQCESDPCRVPAPKCAVRGGQAAPRCRASPRPKNPCAIASARPRSARGCRQCRHCAANAPTRMRPPNRDQPPDQQSRQVVGLPDVGDGPIAPRYWREQHAQCVKAEPLIQRNAGREQWGGSSQAPRDLSIRRERAAPSACRATSSVSAKALRYRPTSGASAGKLNIPPSARNTGTKAATRNPAASTSTRQGPRAAHNAHAAMGNSTAAIIASPSNVVHGAA